MGRFLKTIFPKRKSKERTNLDFRLILIISVLGMLNFLILKNMYKLGTVVENTIEYSLAALMSFSILGLTLG